MSMLPYNTIKYNTLLTLPWWGFSVTMQLTIQSNICIRINYAIDINSLHTILVFDIYVTS